MNEPFLKGNQPGQNFARHVRYAAICYNEAATDTSCEPSSETHTSHAAEQPPHNAHTHHAHPEHPIIRAALDLLHFNSP